MLPGLLVELLAVPLILLGDPRLQRVVGHRLHQQAADGLEHAQQLAGGLPVLGLEGAEADAALRVVGDVGVVDARGEGDDGGLEGVFDGEVDDEAEGAAGVGGGGRAGEGHVPLVEVGLRGEGDGHAGGRGLGALG